MTQWIKVFSSLIFHTPCKDVMSDFTKLFTGCHIFNIEHVYLPHRYHALQSWLAHTHNLIYGRNPVFCGYFLNTIHLLIIVYKLDIDKGSEETKIIQ